MGGVFHDKYYFFNYLVRNLFICQSQRFRFSFSSYNREFALGRSASFVSNVARIIIIIYLHT